MSGKTLTKARASRDGARRKEDCCSGSMAQMEQEEEADIQYGTMRSQGRLFINSLIRQVILIRMKGPGIAIADKGCPSVSLSQYDVSCSSQLLIILFSSQLALSLHGMRDGMLLLWACWFWWWSYSVPLWPSSSGWKGSFWQGLSIFFLKHRNLTSSKVRVVEHKRSKKLYALKYIDKARCLRQKAVANIIQERRLLEEVLYFHSLDTSPQAYILYYRSTIRSLLTFVTPSKMTRIASLCWTWCLGATCGVWIFYSIPSLILIPRSSLRA